MFPWLVLLFNVEAPASRFIFLSTSASVVDYGRSSTDAQMSGRDNSSIGLSRGLTSHITPSWFPLLPSALAHQALVSHYRYGVRREDLQWKISRAGRHILINSAIDHNYGEEGKLQGEHTPRAPPHDDVVRIHRLVLVQVEVPTRSMSTLVAVPIRIRFRITERDTQSRTTFNIISLCTKQKNVAASGQHVLAAHRSRQVGGRLHRRAVGAHRTIQRTRPDLELRREYRYCFQKLVVLNSRPTPRFL